MRRRNLMVLAVLAVASMAPAPDSGDLGRLQGVWEASVGRRGEFSVAIEVKGSEVSATITPKVGPKLKANGELQLDESATPRRLDWVKFSTPEGIEVPTLLAIYRIEGDSLILRSGGFNDGRPRAFEKGGEGCWSDVLVFRKTAPKPDDVAAHP